MELQLVAKPFYRTWTRHRGRKRYQRLETGKKVMQVARFGGNIPPRRFWKIKAVPKLRLKKIIVSPLKLLRKLKNSYLNLMFNLAGNVGSLNTDNVFGNKRIPKARDSKVVYSSEEVENRLVSEIYKALVIMESNKSQKV